MCMIGAPLGLFDASTAQGKITDPAKVAQYKQRQATMYNKPGREQEAYTKMYNAGMGIKLGSAGKSGSPAPTASPSNVNVSMRDQVITSRNRN